MKKIDPSEYMVDGGDDCSYTVAPYKKGSLDNKIGMTVLWTYYVLFAAVSYTHLTLPTTPYV